MHCVTSRFGYPNYQLPELSLVPVSLDNRRSAVFQKHKQKRNNTKDRQTPTHTQRHRQKQADDWQVNADVF